MTMADLKALRMSQQQPHEDGDRDDGDDGDHDDDDDNDDDEQEENQEEEEVSFIGRWFLHSGNDIRKEILR